MGSVLRVDVKTGNDMSEGKIVEELMNVVKVKFNKGSTSPEREGKLLLNMRPLMKTLVEVLDNILSQNFNIFELEAHCYQNSVFVLMNYYFYNYNWSSLKISETKYMNLVYNIQKNYNDNPYHNATHAADVVNTCYFMLERLNVRSDSAFTDLETLVLLLSCATHDIDHPGHTNAFEINSRSLLALTYNDKSVLENYHLFLFFNFLINDNMNIFIEFDLNEIKIIRKLFISNIIATDMMNHANDLKKLKDMVNNPSFDKTKTENKEFMMTQLIHFADISNGSKPMDIYNKWVDKLFVEFFAQGDKEKEMGLPISMLCDREKTTIPDTQVFFIGFFTMDLIKTISVAYPKFDTLIQVLETNKKKWEEKKGKPYEIRNWD
jgi:hypothetical protein